ncbi:hypothetical protein F8388_005387 [Cannabis sativa]|uniref:RNase H type-1 domain-containing protein n=1 Tax=Cannabis sativa TaxID=3483 RepID=A0A7J6EHV4_CANSA|nr:hypothetical protein F8388_005387 [Cannabis sativa]
MEETFEFGKISGFPAQMEPSYTVTREDIPWTLGTPVDTHLEDTLIWPFSTNGHYLVKSGYRVARESNLCPTRCSDIDQINAWWQMWWQLQLPPQIKLFGRSMFDLLVEFRQQLSKEEFEEVIKVLWAIWENRNRQWNKLPVMDETRLIEWGEKLQTNSYTCYSSGALVGPPEGIYCVHCDAALNLGKEGVGLGFIWRDWSGKIIAACMIYIPTICSVILSEAEAIFTALKACPIDSSSFFEIRTDCKRLVDEFKEEGSNLSYVSLVFNKIKCHQRFPLCTKLNFVNRINNEIAHSLAKRSLENKLTQSFLNSFP